MEVETVTNNLRFSGQNADAETGLHANWFRYYDPTIGRYVQKDPIGLLSGDVTQYQYARGNPNAWIDPFGLFVPAGGKIVVDVAAVAASIAAGSAGTAGAVVVAGTTIATMSVGTIVAAGGATGVAIVGGSVVVAFAGGYAVGTVINVVATTVYKTAYERWLDGGPPPEGGDPEDGDGNDEDCEENCDQGKYKTYDKCEEITDRYPYETVQDLKRAVGKYSGVDWQKLTTKNFEDLKTKSGDCKKKKGQQHGVVKGPKKKSPKGKGYYATFFSCPCCKMVQTSSGAKPQEFERWRYKPKF